MKKIVIIGQSVTAIKAIEQIRAVDQESEVIVVSSFDGLPFLQERFPEWIGRQIEAEHVFYKNEKFYRNLRIEFLSGQKISRINFSRKMIFFEDKTKIDADVLVLADSDKHVFPGLKGWNREGVFSFMTGDQILRFHGMLGRIDTVIIESASLRGVMFAKALVAQNKEVIFCLPEVGILPGLLDPKISDFLITLMQQAGMRVVRNGKVNEVLGDDDVKAARLDIGKVIACEAAIFPDALPDMRLYQKNEFQISDRIVVDRFQQTSCPGVFALDEMTDTGNCFMRFFDYEALRHEQSTRLAIGITGVGDILPAIIRHVCVNLSGRELILMGNLCPLHAEVLTVSDENGALSARVFLQNNIVIGAFLVDNTAIGNHLLQLMKSGQSIDWEKDEFFSSYSGKKEDFLPLPLSEKTTMEPGNGADILATGQDDDTA